MNNLILPVKIAPITPELLEWFRANAGTMRLGFDGERYGHCWFSGDKFHWDVSRHNKTPEFILPDGLPDPSAAVEVFEREVTTDSADWLCANPTEKMIGCAHIFAPENMEVGDMVGVFLLPEVSK
jgi:hypothetical protein